MFLKNLMYKKWILLLLLLTTMSAAAKLTNESSNKTKQIKGYAPYIQSIAAQANLDNQYIFFPDLTPALTPGIILAVPSSLCSPELFKANEDLQPYFNLRDEDNDKCSVLETHNLDWYILDNKDTEWNAVVSPDDLIWTLITDVDSILPPSTNMLSQYTSRLKIPENAVNKRIGFTYSPISATGNPNKGTQAKIWDISYFFGQKPTSQALLESAPNLGEKITQIPLPIHTQIKPNFARPIIKTLYMYGEFSLSSTLEAQYQIEPDSIGSNELEMRFWWGPKGTTKNLGRITNTDFQNSPYSPPLTDSDIGSVIEVTAMAIKKQDGLLIVSEPYTIDSQDPNNQFYYPPSIDNLTLSMQPRVNESVYGKYTFNDGGKKNSIDNSTYIWQIENDSGKWDTLITGTILESGVTPEFKNLKQEYAGKSLKLEIIPSDTDDRIGSSNSVTSEVIGVLRIETNYNEVDYIINQTNALQLKATIYYSNGDIITHNINKWQSDDKDVSIDSYGFVTVNPELTEEKTVNITISYLGQQALVKLNIRKNTLIINELHFNEPILINKKITASYLLEQFNSENLDESTYEWFYLSLENKWIKFDEGKVNDPGMISTVSTIDHLFAGKRIRLEVTPFNQVGDTGPISSIEGNVESLIELILTPSELTFNANESQSKQINAIASYEYGSQLDLTSIGIWQSDNNSILVSSNGSVSIVNQNEAIQGKVMFIYNEFTREVNVKVTPVEPSIQNLIIKGSPIINGTLEATYEFDSNLFPNFEDNSTYTWFYTLPGSSKMFWSDGTISQSGVIPPSPKIEPFHAGASITLEVIPTDQFGVTGEKSITSMEIEHLVSLSLAPNELRFNLGETSVKKVTASALYSLGSVIDVSAKGSWSAGNPNVLIETNGNVFISSLNSMPITSEVNFKYGVLTSSIPVIVQSITADIRNLRLIGTPMINQSIEAVYDFDPNGMLNIIDKSTYRWFYKDFSNNQVEWSRGDIIQSGLVPNSPIIDASKVGYTIIVEVTPNDQFERPGATQVAQSVVETVTNIEIIFPRTEKMNTVAPTYLMAKGTLESGTIIDITSNGTWTTTHPNVTSLGNGVFTVPYYVYEEQDNIPITFTYQKLSVTKVARADNYNLGDLLGAASFYREHAVVIYANSTPEIRLWGDYWLSSARNNQNIILSGGSTGVECGAFSQNGCYLELSRLQVNSGLKVDMTYDAARPNDTTIIRSLSWYTNDNVLHTFVGNASGTSKSQTDIIRNTAPIYGIIFFSTGAIGSSTSYIKGLRLIYQ
ncbi:hypothetical protein [Thorsellia anophelis]|uniref:Ig-like domain (Group 2) n=1 Tax=Thorsellia anophelis DSM 18579 TaxID=1123402 RepID=A0A1I0BHH6_9GAMM|nr:hypothetical protein [Thorsellia anophelis]SET06354.1 hypothetical protein SAMN02583745_01258 [Thorsellia anophelis DSM 18579]